MHTYSVWILTNRSGTLYVGMTNNIRRRLNEQRAQEDSGAFSAQYKTGRLIYVEQYRTAKGAIAREKQPKGWRREKKVALINVVNPS